MKNRILNILYQPTDIASLAVFRMLFGALIMFETSRYIDLQTIVRYFNMQTFHFKFRYFEWVPALSASHIQLVFIAYGIAGLAILLGIFYHFAILTASLCISYIFLIDATNYLNHFYLIIIVSFTMLFLPAHKGWSLYAWIRKSKAQSTVPSWAMWILRSQLTIVYVHAAIAKMNVDWINGMPLTLWLTDFTKETGRDLFLAWPISIYAFAYLGLIYDLLIAPMLLYKPTRALAYCLGLCFHLTNSYLFHIGIFPWFMLAISTIYFDSDWPRKLLNFLSNDRFKTSATTSLPAHLSFIQKVGFAAMITHLSFQTLFPLRGFLWGRYISWTEEGHNFSWHMKLRSKNGSILFTLKDPQTGRSELINPHRYLTKRQVSQMATSPFFIVQFSHYLRDLFTKPGEIPVEVYVETRARVNGRKAQRLVDPEVNFAQITMKDHGNEWIFPLRRPVWNATNKKNRFGPAFNNDDYAQRATKKMINSQELASRP